MAKVTLFKRIQAGTDAYYNYTYYSGSIGVQAYREGWDNGLRGDALVQFRNEKIANPPANYNTKAVAEAHRLTGKRKRRWKFVGWLAAIVWLGSGFYFFLTTGQASLFSLVSLSFFVIGTFVAKLFIGGIFHILWGVANFLQLAVIAAVESLVTGARSQEWIRFERLVVTVLFNSVVCIAEIISTFVLASWVFYRMSI